MALVAMPPDRKGPLTAEKRKAGLSPWLILVIPPLLWAGNFVVGRAVHAAITPLSLTFWRWVVAALILLPLAGADAWRSRKMLGRHILLLSALSLSGVVGFQFLVYHGLQTTTAVSGVLIIAIIPVAIPLFSFLFDRTPVPSREAAGIALSMLGVTVIVLKGDPGSLIALPITSGDFWVLLAVPAWAVYSVLLRRRPSDLRPLTMLLATILLGVAFLAPFYGFEVTRGNNGIATGINIQIAAAVLYVGVFASVVAFACWNHGVSQVGAARAGLYIHLMPVFAAILAVALLGERFHGYHFAGMALVGVGLWLSSTAKSDASQDVPTMDSATDDRR